MRITFDIKKITVMTGANMTDKVTIHTNSPSPFPVGVGNDNLMMNFDVQKGKGIAYVKRNFISPILFVKNPILEHINTDTGEYRIISTGEE